jgi:hypothetical protein
MLLGLAWLLENRAGLAGLTGSRRFSQAFPALALAVPGACSFSPGHGVTALVVGITSLAYGAFFLACLS